MRIAVAMPPTPAFGTLIAEMLHDRFGAPEPVGGLVIHTLATTVAPTSFFGRAPPEWQEPHAPEIEPAAADAGRTGG